MNAEEHTTGDRRPIASRDLKISQQLTQVFARWGASPNGISLFGMMAAIAGGVTLAATRLDPAHARWLWLAGALGAQLRLAANMFDGMVAIATGRSSPVGELYNEVPDRISDIALLVGLGYSAGGDPTLGYLAALMAVFTAYVRAQCRVAGAPQDYCGPMAKPQRMFWLTLNCVAMAVAPAHWQLAELLTPVRGLAAITLGWIAVLSLRTAVRRLSAEQPI